MNSDQENSKPTDFIRAIINEDLRCNKHEGQVVTRFPPEPNGFLHIGHAKSICLNFGLAKEYQGTCHLRFDDTNPTKEDVLFVDSIKEAIHWLGFDWGPHLYHASDYFERLYDLATRLIQKDKAYVCSLSLDDIRTYRGTVKEAGVPSPFRDRSIEENLDLFSRMKLGEFKEGEHVLRAKIDMASSNMKMRDPLLYRIRHVPHHMTGDQWCIYPLYDFTHCLSDSIEGITHSICTLEFENNRELYDWIIDTLDMPCKPRQYEFARLNINYAVMSKRKIQELVHKGLVEGWDDPRLLTIAGLRRRGYTPESIRNFCSSVGIAKANSVVDMAQLEYSIRNDLNQKAPRVLAVLDPLKVTITNYPEGKVEELNAPYFPEEIPRNESRPLPFSKELYIDKEDFSQDPPKGFFRLKPGGEVRLRYAYIIRCDEVVKDSEGNVCELRCSYDETTRIGEKPSDGRKVKGIIHWVSAAHALPATVHAYDRLFTVENPGVGEHEDFLSFVNPHSLQIYSNAQIEPSVKDAAPETHFQFERHGFFVTDRLANSSEALIFNRTVSLKDSWNKSSQIKKPPQGPPKEKESPKQNQTLPLEKLLSSEEKEICASLQKTYQIPSDYAALLAQNSALTAYFQEAAKAHSNPLGIANWLVNDLLRELKEVEQGTFPFPAAHLAQLVQCIDEELISSKIAKDVLSQMLVSKQTPHQIIEEKGLRQLSNSAELEPLIDQLIADHPDIVEQICAGRSNRIGFFVGQIMKATAGKANPKLVNELLRQRIFTRKQADD